MRSLILLILLAISLPLYARYPIGTRDVVTGLKTPWEIIWGPDSMIWMTERIGPIFRVDPVTGVKKQIHKIWEVFESPECGLMGMALHPHFTDSPYVYTAYTRRLNETTWRVHLVRFTYDKVKDTLTNRIYLIDTNKIVGGTTHDGCRLLIDSTDMTMYVTTGDAENEYSNPQSDTSYNGKVLRMNLDGSVPADNPIPGSHVWSKGHRNAQGLAFGRNKIMYETMHGTYEDDEINIVEKGKNYGWPYINGVADLQDELKFAQDSGAVDPIFTWSPTVAPAGCLYYDHEEFPFLRNSLLVAVLKGDGANKESYLFAAHLDSSGTKVIDTSRYFYGELGRLRDLCIAPDGRIFISTSNRDYKGNPKPEDDRIIELTFDSSLVSVDAPVAESPIHVAPNPMTGNATRLTVPEELIGTSYQLMDALGKVVRTGILRSTEHTIGREDLSTGVYILRIEAKEPLIQRIIVH